MRITESLLVQCPSSDMIVVMDESTGAEIVVPMEAADHFIEAVAYFRRVSSHPLYGESVRLPDEPERTRILINPNLRIDGAYTMVDLDDIFGPPPKVGEQVEVFTDEPLNWVGTGRVTTIDRHGHTVKLAVDWSSLRKK